MPQHRQINLSSRRKCLLPFFPTVMETTIGSPKSASGSLSDPRVSGSPSLPYSHNDATPKNKRDAMDGALFLRRPSLKVVTDSTLT